MKRFVRLTVGMLLCAGAVLSARGFTSLYIFGDGLSSTTNGPGGSSYYGLRYSNGLVWVEDLAQMQGLPFDNTKNWSYFGDYSSVLTNYVAHFAAPGDVNTALFVLWVNNADLLDAAENDGTTLSVWTTAINRSQTNHLKMILSLYGKGVRTLIMPSPADISKAPYFLTSSASDRGFISSRCYDYKVSFAATLNQARAACPALTIYSPDFLTLASNFMAYAPNYGLTNAIIDALEDSHLKDKSLTGPGANYVWWDYLDPTAKVHTVLATFTQQLLSPVQPYINDITLLGGNNRLDAANIPVGRDGYVDSSPDLINWSSLKWITNSANATQSILVPASSSSQQFYRLRFP